MNLFSKLRKNQKRKIYHCAKADKSNNFVQKPINPMIFVFKKGLCTLNFAKILGILGPTPKTCFAEKCI